MKHGSLFSGIGGFDLAAEWMGWENVFHCEINPIGRRVLKYYWPDSISHEDAKTTDWTIYRGAIDVLSGGDPCQGNSVIGKREAENYEGYMWPTMFGATEKILPGYLVNENVPGSISNGILDRKITDLQSIGYTCWPPVLIPASDVGAWHKRARVLLVAYSPERRLEGRVGGKEKDNGKQRLDQLRHWWKIKTDQSIPSQSFYEAMMGFPEHWLLNALKHSETL